MQSVFQFFLVFSYLAILIEFDLFQVECRNGDTTAGKVFETDVPQCSGQHCIDEFAVPLSENDLAQMKVLVDRSLECVQQIEIKCLGAPLQVKPFLYQILWSPE